MDLRKVKDEDKLDLCRKYFLGGCALLPFMWVINCVWFFNEAFRKPAFEQQLQIKKYWMYSFAGAVIWTAVFCAWLAVFLTHRIQWGATADAMSYTLPIGRP